MNKYIYIYMKEHKSAFFEFKSGPSRKFWRIVKNGTQITTHYGRIGTLGQMTKKDYGSKVDVEYDKLIKSKKKKRLHRNTRLW